MSNIPLQAVILAAGESSRFWPLNSRHKSLLKIMGKPLICYTIESLIAAGIKNLVIVQGPSRDVEVELKNYVYKAKIDFVIQEKALGIGNAILKAKDYLKNNFFVLWSTRISCYDAVIKMIQYQQNTGAKMVLAGEKTSTPWLYGITKMEGDRVLDIIEKPAQGTEPSDINVSGIRLLGPEIIGYLEQIAGTRTKNDEFEYAMSLYAKNYDSRIIILEKDDKNVSLKYPWHLFVAQKYLFHKFLTKSQIAKSAQIAKNVTIDGNVVIGENVKVFEGAVIKGPCYIGDNSIIGNNSIVRDFANLEASAMVGALCEVSRTIFEPDVHVHSGYFGDSILDRGVRIGAGAITANVRTDHGEIFALVKKESNGQKKIDKVSVGTRSLGIIIGQNTKIGTRATFMPARFIGKNCQVSPAALIMHNLENNSKY